MGWWKLEFEKLDMKGHVIPLSQKDLEYIANEIKDGMIEGEVFDGEDE